MATKQTKHALEALFAVSPQKAEDIETISDVAAGFAFDAGEVLDLGKAVEVLARVREANRVLDAATKEATEELTKQLKPFTSQRLAMTKQLDASDKSLSARIIEAYSANPEEIGKRLEGLLGASATVTQRGYSFSVIDITKVDSRFITPPPPPEDRIDAKEITEFMAETGKAPDGIKATPNLILTTRATSSIRGG